MCVNGPIISRYLEITHVLKFLAAIEHPAETNPHMVRENNVIELQKRPGLQSAK